MASRHMEFESFACAREKLPSGERDRRTEIPWRRKKAPIEPLFLISHAVLMWNVCSLALVSRFSPEIGDAWEPALSTAARRLTQPGWASAQNGHPRTTKTLTSHRKTIQHN